MVRTRNDVTDGLLSKDASASDKNSLKFAAGCPKVTKVRTGNEVADGLLSEDVSASDSDSLKMPPAVRR
ncbi:hypothetical protein D1B31_14160 [Neobacillus notoginsengisoli]|uniref:Uncharacterized protein n=1 Tax=Neobacillus notoginsengisoli TaxID=1578198 RepID=A0A417YT24_9BACI|nr:hypothetical protein D1B31_14160 [Neobacillus notoginsengisoli]